MTQLLEVRNLSKSFGGIRAVDNITFDIAEGELLAMIGPNGAGKSTCFNLINGQLKPDRNGSIKILGKETAGMRPRHIWALGVGRTFQVTSIFPSMTVIENVQVALLSEHKHSMTVSQKVAGLYREEAMKLLQLVGIDSQWNYPCSVLSYGNLKRVDLAIALTNKPKLLLMDEPAAGMGSKEILKLMELISYIVHEESIGVFFTEHNMDVIFAYADRVIVLNRGKLIAEGTPQQMRENKEVRKIYLGTSVATANRTPA